MSELESCTAVRRGAKVLRMWRFQLSRLGFFLHRRYFVADRRARAPRTAADRALIPKQFSVSRRCDCGRQLPFPLDVQAFCW